MPQTKSVSKSTTMKQLKYDELRLKNELNEHEKEKRLQETHISVKKAKLKNIREDIEHSSTSKITVSEHAVLRLMERKYGIPVEEYRQELLDTVQKKTTRGVKNFKVNVSDNLQAVVCNSHIVTVNPN